MEKSIYPVIAAASAILLTAAAISASIIYVTKQSDVPAETYYSETSYTRETKLPMILTVTAASPPPTAHSPPLTAYLTSTSI